MVLFSQTPEWKLEMIKHICIYVIYTYVCKRTCSYIHTTVLTPLKGHPEFYSRDRHFQARNVSGFKKEGGGDRLRMRV